MTGRKQKMNLIQLLNVNETALWSDVCQNNIGDCYFLAALSSVAWTNPFWIKNVTALRCRYSDGIKQYSPWHEISFYVPSNSYKSSRKWSDKKETIQPIVVSEDVLVYSASGYNYGASGPKEKQGKMGTSKTDMDACWAAVYEKAYAKFLQRTDSDFPNMDQPISGGYADDALKEILHTTKVKSVALNNLSTNQILDIAKQAHRKPVCASIHKYCSTLNNAAKTKVYYSEAGTQEEYLKMGLYIGHVYSVFDYFTINNKTYIVIRNPHGRNLNALKGNPKVYHKNWGFSYGVNPQPAYRDSYDIYQYLNGTDDPQTSQGLFLMEIDEFKRVFSSIQYCYD